MVILYTRKTQKTGTQLSFHVQGDLEDWHTNVILYLDKKEEKKKKTRTQQSPFTRKDLDTTVTLCSKKFGRLGHNCHVGHKEIWRTGTENVIVCMKRFGKLRHNCTFMHQAIWMIRINMSKI